MRKLITIAIVLLASAVLYAQSRNSRNSCGEGCTTLQSVTQDSRLQVTPLPTWVPDPSAGHYDCPDGWIAYSRSEPTYTAGQLGGLIYHPQMQDAKGHVLADRPEPGICVQVQP